MDDLGWLVSLLERKERGSKIGATITTIVCVHLWFVAMAALEGQDGVHH